MPTMQGVVPSEVLNNASKIPMIGLGPLVVDDLPGATTQAVKDAIDLGYRHFVTTPNVTNEAEVGEAINAKMKEGVVKREELYLVGKLSDTRAFHNPALIMESLMRTLRNLNVAYIDMYILHCPEGAVFANEAFVDTWCEMEVLVDHFLVKSIGLSNFSVAQIEHLLIGARVTPAANEIECNPYITQQTTDDFLHKKHILTMGMNIMGMPGLMEDPVIMDMAKKYKRTPEQILLRYQIDKGHVAIADAQNKNDLKTNLEVFKFDLNKSDISAIDKLNRQKKHT
jgi:aldehyde reductase